ncbi:uncharacterized protein N7458_005796 [Penicillium daleae]|uniref:Zn(2)-C6 fungal-type domain-containing protein n=1 Tax=Penicillium daleae TaxID=63821 RepID=A0AAD6G547_9EURO|nr:uncharacterized protein N7458_005796 [Penicillium daleae]KAJ5454840.1 hypothetical protein N7458_005796 [Penicillium daleae]
MVPAPRRCLRCARSSVQCDGKSPCLRCHNARLPCRFEDNPPETREACSDLPYRSESTSASPASPASHQARSSSQELLWISREGRSDARYLTYSPSNENVTPSLVAKAAAAGQIQLYINFVLDAYPCYFKATETRVPVNWVEYVASRESGDTPFDLAVRSLTTMYAGSRHNDPSYSDAGREFYIRAMRGLSKLLNDETKAKSDEALATAISLAVYEMHCSTTSDGWIHHAAGIRALMRLRGPRTHYNGFGCALYIAYRNTLVTSALVTGEDCFLEEPEWQALNEHIAAENAKQPDSSVYTDITERAFREVVKLPGFVRRMREIQGLPLNVQKRIHTEFSMTASTLRAGREPKTGFIGPIPHHFFDGFSALTMQGIRSSILLLNYIIILLDPSQRPDAEAENRIIADRMRAARCPQSAESHDGSTSPLTPPGSPGRPHLMIESRVTPETRQPPTTDWMDRIATTMGMEGVRISLVDDG